MQVSFISQSVNCFSSQSEKWCKSWVFSHINFYWFVGFGILGMTGRIRLPKDESCGMKYPNEVLLAPSIALLWVDESIWGDSTGLVELEDPVLFVLLVLGIWLVVMDIPVEEEDCWFICFFRRSSSSKIFLCWSILKNNIYLDLAWL